MDRTSNRRATVAATLPTEPIRRRKLYEELVERIEAAILDGQLVPGDQLPSERDLMEAYKVGRTSVREALFALQRMGLVVLTSGERARVIQPTPEAIVTELSGAARHLLAQPEGVRHFQQARLFFETSLARFAAQAAGPSEIAALGAALEANARAIGNPKLFAHTDVAFHFVLAQMPGNPIFTALHSAIVGWLTEQRSTSSRAVGSNQAAYEAHVRIYDAIAAGLPEAAAAAMHDHLDEVNRFYWDIKRAEGQPARGSRAGGNQARSAAPGRPRYQKGR